MTNATITATGSAATPDGPAGETSVAAADLARRRRRATPGRLDALRGREVDASDLPSRAGRVDDPSSIRGAILRAMGEQHVGRAELHRRASALRPELSRSQVYEFVAGSRDVRASAAEAMLRALGLAPARVG